MAEPLTQGVIFPAAAAQHDRAESCVHADWILFAGGGREAKSGSHAPRNPDQCENKRFLKQRHFLWLPLGLIEF